MLLIDKGANVNVIDRVNSTSLLEAISRLKNCPSPSKTEEQSQWKRILTKLLENGADAKQPYDGSGQTALHLAADLNAATAIDIPLDYGENLDTYDALGRTPLYSVVVAQNLNAVEALTRRGANPIALKESHGTGLTPLGKATELENPIIIDLMLSVNKCIGKATIHGEYAICYASRNCGANTVHALLANGANANDIRSHDWQPPIVLAILASDRIGRFEVVKNVKLLLKYGACLKIRTAFRLTPLYHAAQQGHIELRLYYLPLMQM